MRAMPERRIFVDVPIAPEQSMALPDSAAHHLARVLRVREGELLALFDGSGGEYPAVVAAVTRGGVQVQVGALRVVERESALQITLVQALQAADKMDTTIQKAVELGVSRIVPVAAERSVLRLSGERAERRQAHWRHVVAAACEQCGRNRLPGVETIRTLPEWFGEPSTVPLRLLLSPAGDAGLSALPPASAVELLVGPEGGFAEHELASAALAGYRPLRAGPRVLRTETAGPALIAALQARWGDFA
ncbi:MAG TPA: 16S rRNA (uracil(1498)-N(3))-methyltransferase [Rhodocyclaceae bacterium]